MEAQFSGLGLCQSASVLICLGVIRFSARGFVTFRHRQWKVPCQTNYHLNNDRPIDRYKAFIWQLHRKIPRVVNGLSMDGVCQIRGALVDESRRLLTVTEEFRPMGLMHGHIEKENKNFPWEQKPLFQAWTKNLLCKLAQKFFKPKNVTWADSPGQGWIVFPRNKNYFL